MLSTILGLFSYDLAIDLGTSSTLIHVSGKGISIREATVVARVKKTKEIIAVGNAAKRMIGRAGKTIEVIRPLRNGKIEDMDATVTILATLIKKVHAHSKIASRVPRSKIVVGVPGDVTTIQREAVKEVFMKAGARKVTIIDEAYAAALGSVSKLSEITGIGVIDIGAGTTDMALISSGRIVFNRSIKTAGDEMDNAIVTYFKFKYSLLIGDSTAEAVKINLATAIKDKEHFNVVRGRSLEERIPKSIKVSSFEMYEVLLPYYEKISNEFYHLLQEAPPDLIGDISQSGVILAGGGSLIRGLSQFLQKRLSVPISTASDPLTAVVRGSAKVLEN